VTNRKFTFWTTVELNFIHLILSAAFTQFWCISYK